MSTPSIYSDGLISVTQDSAAFTGTGTAWTTQLKAATLILVKGAGGAVVPWPVLSIAADGAGTFADPYPGETAVDAEYIAITWNSGAELATGLRTLLTQLLGMGLTDVVEAVPIAADHRDKSFVYNDTSGILYVIWQGQAIPVTHPMIGEKSIWLGAEERFALSISTGDVAIDGDDATAVSGVRYYHLAANASFEIQLPVNVAEGDIIDLTVTIDGGSVVPALAAGITGMVAEQIRDEDEATTRFRLTVTEVETGDATAATAALYTFPEDAAVKHRGGFYLSTHDDNSAEPQLDELGNPKDSADWLAQFFPKGDPGSALLTATSATPRTIAAGEHTITLAENDERGYGIGSTLNVASAADPEGHAMLGAVVTAYDHASLTFVAPLEGLRGTGDERDDWVITVGGTRGLPGLQSGFSYEWTATTSGDPTPGFVGGNNADPTLITSIRIDEIDSIGADRSVSLQALDNSTSSIKADIFWTSVLDPSNWIHFELTDAFVDETGWLSGAVDYVAHEGTLSGPGQLLVKRTPDKGTDGAGTGDVVGPASSTTGHVAVFADGTGKEIEDGGALANVAFSGAADDVEFDPTGLTNTDGADLQEALEDHDLAITAAATAAIGQQTISMPASGMAPRDTNGAAEGRIELPTNDVMVDYLAFDSSTSEGAQFGIWMPKGWDEGTIIAQFVWMHPATTVNFGVKWGIRAVAFANDDAMDAAFGTEQEVADTGGTTHDQYTTAETSPMTVAGSPGAEEWVVFEVYRDPADAADNLAVDAWLIGVKLHYTVNAAKDD